MPHGDDDGHETCIRLSISSTINWRVAWWWVGIYLLINFRKSRRLLGRVAVHAIFICCFCWISASHTPNISHTVDSKRSVLTLPKALATAQLTRLLRQQFNDIKIDVRKHSYAVTRNSTASTHHTNIHLFDTPQPNWISPRRVTNTRAYSARDASHRRSIGACT